MAIKIPVGENIIFMAILHDIAVSVYYHSNFLYRHKNSLLYQINLSVLDYRMLASSNFLGKTLLVYWPVIGLQKREKEGGGKEGIFDMSLMSKISAKLFCFPFQKTCSHWPLHKPTQRAKQKYLHDPTTWLKGQ